MWNLHVHLENETEKFHGDGEGRKKEANEVNDCVVTINDITEKVCDCYCDATG